MVSPECRRLKIGNPESMEGPFYEVFHGRVCEDWKRFSISAFDSPNVTAGRIVVHGLVGPEWIDLKRREFGEESNYWRTKVLGRFPLDVVERLIPMDWIRAAQERWKEMQDSHAPGAGWGHRPRRGQDGPGQALRAEDPHGARLAGAGCHAKRGRDCPHHRCGRIRPGQHRRDRCGRWRGGPREGDPAGAGGREPWLPPSPPARSAGSSGRPSPRRRRSSGACPTSSGGR